MGLPSAVEETRLVEDGFGWKGRIKENGKALVRESGATRPCIEGVSDDARRCCLEGAGWDREDEDEEWTGTVEDDMMGEWYYM